MDAQDFRSLQEAYMEVYEEVSNTAKRKFEITKMKKKLQPPYSSDWNKKISFALQDKIVKLTHICGKTKLLTMSAKVKEKEFMNQKENPVENQKTSQG
jgi:hypothetical protein